MLPIRYPCWALTARVQGRVKLHFKIDDSGAPRDIELISGHPLLVRDAIAHLKTLKVRPNGNTPKSTRRTAIYVFRLDPSAKSATDLASTKFSMPNAIIVLTGYVQPSSPCDPPLVR
ncbi:MAG: energy transducer TonB [Bryobacteraceae bacterium]|jgi:hypothetical protein